MSMTDQTMTQEIEIFTSEEEIRTKIGIPRQEGDETPEPRIVRQAREFTIESEVEYEASFTLIQKYKRGIAGIRRFFKPLKDAAHAAHKAVTASESEFLGSYLQAEKIVMDNRAAYRRAAKERDEAKEREERAAATLEQQRVLAEHAETMRQQGDVAAADTIEQMAATAPPPSVFVQSSVPEQKGSTVKRIYVYRIVREDLIPREYCDPSPKKLKAHVDAFGLKAGIPGIEVVEDEKENVRQAKKKSS